MNPCPKCAEDLDETRMCCQGAAEAVCRSLRADNKRLSDALRELVALMEDVRAGTYTPDSFTTQPANEALAGRQAACNHVRTVSRTAGDPFLECLICGAFMMIRDQVWRMP